MTTSPTPCIPIVVKHGNTVYHIQLDPLAALDPFRLIAEHIRIPSDRLKLIAKGKRYTRDNRHELVLVANMTLLSIGEQQEDETDVNLDDVDCIVRQVNVDRNAAVRALRLHPNVIDAILYLGNK